MGLRDHLVAHRGFHSPIDSTERPLENTLAALEHAWAVSGLHMAECDVGVTADGEAVLCHDVGFARLALHPREAAEPLERMTLAQVRAISLRNGSTACTLREALVAAARLKASLVVEVKNPDAVRPIIRLIHEPAFAGRVGAIISFSLDALRTIAEERPIPPLFLITQRKDTASPGDIVLNIEDPGPVEALLGRPPLNGIYVEFQPELLTSAKFAGLCMRRPIGVWGIAGIDLDSAEIATRLVQRGVTLVNTDLPPDFGFHPSTEYMCEDMR